MQLTNEQKDYLHKKFGIESFEPEKLCPLKIWQLREDLIDLECDADLDCTERTRAAHIVDFLSKLPETCFPLEWKLKTPPEIEAMLKSAVPGKAVISDGTVLGSALRNALA